MQDELLAEVKRHQVGSRWRKLRRDVVRVLSGIVVFCTTYALILPAITLEKSSCTLEEHTHSESCYEQVTVQQVSRLTCSYASLGVHTHTEECGGGQDSPACGYADYVVHVHDAACLDASGTLVCQLPEIKLHEHTQEECYQPAEPVQTHSHTEECYAREKGELTCRLPETPGHAHTDECYTLAQEPVCGKEESQGHTHTEACRSSQLNCQLTMEPHEHGEGCYQQLTCELPEDENHSHSDQCTGKILTCTLTEQPHEHGEGCYEEILVCGQEESEGHSHSRDCMDPQLTCGQEEVQAHTHGDDCYSWNTTLICGMEEGQLLEEPEYVLACEQAVIRLHTHEETCYETYLDEEGGEQKRLTCTELVVQAHTHGEGCFTVEEQPAEDLETLTCTMEESEGHTHGEGCYDETETLTCTTEESEGHSHSERCYGTWKLICGREEHTHDLYCQNDPEADVETEEVWKATFADVTMKNDWAADTLAIARTQLGYTESSRNYAIMEDGVTTKGYTRYGAWYQDPCGDWNTLFAMFCLHYGGVQEFPVHPDGAQWRDALSEESCGLYRDTVDWQPKRGQLVFLSGEPVRVGLVESVKTTGDMVTLTVIEGDAENRVQRKTCGIDQVAGYVDLGEAQTRFVQNHVHGDTCYTPQLACTWQPHQHEENCYDAQGNLTCQIDPEEVHEHSEGCYERILTCTVGQTTAEQYLCGLDEHTHDPFCRDENNALVCNMEEHTHYLLCTDPQAKLYCWLTEHRHGEACLDENGSSICELEEHIHDSRCCDYIEALIVMIDILPTSEEAEAILAAFEETEDWDGYAAYQKKIADHAWKLYYACEELSADELVLVTNYDRLTDLAWLWSRVAYAADISKVTYNPEYTTDDYHSQWTTPGGWITQSTDSRVHINEIVPDMYTIDGLVLGEKSADSVIASFTPLYNSAPSDAAAEEATGFTWETLAGTGMDCTYGANLVLPSDKSDKKALLNSDIYVVYKNIGTYGGHVIDLKLSLVDYENYVDWQTNTVTEGFLGFWTQDIRTDQPTYGQRLPGISACGISWVRVLYTFVDSTTGEEVDVKGSTSFYDLDFGQAVHIRAGDTKLMGIYVTDVNSSVPNLNTVNGYNTRSEQRGYFEGWTPDDCVLKYSSVAPVTEAGNTMTGVVVYSPHGNDSGTNSEQYGDTKHAFTMTFARNNINIVYSFDKGKNAVRSNSETDTPTYYRNANGGIIHSAVPVYTGSLDIQKRVTGFVDEHDRDFRFRIEFYKTGTTVDTGLSGTFGGVTLNNGVGTFTLKDGESIRITGIPIRQNGTPYKVTELDYEGYIVETSMTCQTLTGDPESYGAYKQDYYGSALQPDAKMAQHQIVVFQNYGQYRLPETGGTGTCLYTLGGAVLTGLPLLYVCCSRRRRRASCADRS